MTANLPVETGARRASVPSPGKPQEAQAWPPEGATDQPQAAADYGASAGSATEPNTPQDTGMAEGMPMEQVQAKVSGTGPIRGPASRPREGPPGEQTRALQAAARAEKAGRVRISSIAVAAFEYVYALEKKPNEALVRVLGQAFGETFLRVKVWFQNRRGRDTKEDGGEPGVPPAYPPHMPPAVLSTLLSRQSRQRPEVAQELQLALQAATGSSDVAATTAQALNAMLTVNSISRFWGHHNHLLSGEVVLPGGEHVSLTALAQDEGVRANALLAAVLDRALELRQGIIDQFVMTDQLIREVLPIPPALDKQALLQPHPAAYGQAVPHLPDNTRMNWEQMGYTDVGSGRAAGDAGSSSSERRTPVAPMPKPILRSKAKPRSVAAEEDVSQMFMVEVDPNSLPVSARILEDLVRAIHSSQPSYDSMQEAVASGPFSPADFHRLISFISLHEDAFHGRPGEQKIAGGAVHFRDTPTLPGFAGWWLGAEDFGRLLPVPLTRLLMGAWADGSRVSQVYVIYDVERHILTLRALVARA